MTKNYDYKQKTINNEKQKLLLIILGVFLTPTALIVIFLLSLSQINTYEKDLLYHIDGYFNHYGEVPELFRNVNSVGRWH